MTTTESIPPTPGSEAARPVPTNVLGLRGEFTDPLWRISVRLRPVEVELLRTEPLRRLHFVTHGGASTLSTLQSYSRLEHTLGVLALVAHFRPEDELLRTAALLHDIGHLPLSHTFEGIGGLDHHAIGARLLRADPIRPALERHAISAGAVAAVLDGEPLSPLTGRSGLMNLDHLDSYVRSGRAAGHLDADPAALLSRLDLTDSAVSTDPRTAAVLVALVRAEARLHTSWDNAGPVSVVRRLAGRLLDGGTLTPARLARLTDHQLWSAFEACPATRAESHLIRYEPHRLAVTLGLAPEESTGWDFSLRKIYRSAPLVDGRPLEEAAPGLAAELAALSALPTDFHVRWSGA
ncbi:HD domain-containing protein [Kitasatospora sp. NPDC002227]|uniref:HD domain-containing protein n=1 Tax=Kitasatospora sp. NPDC002227 TaxID=3154773 RepID=UPI00331CE493